MNANVCVKAGDNGGQCQNCGHFPSVHVNLGKVDAGNFLNISVLSSSSSALLSFISNFFANDKF